MQSIEKPNEFEQTIYQDYDTMTAIYDKYERLIYSFAYRITQDSELAEQAAAKVFLAIWRQPAFSGDETRHFTSIILMMTRKFALDALKGGLQADLDIEKTPDWQEKRAELSESLLHLKESHQNILKWVYFDGLSQYAIAKRLNIPTGSVPYRIREAFAQMDPSSEKVNNKITCPFNRKLADYFALQLSQIETTAFEQHLTSCSTCKAELTEWQRLTEDFAYLSETQDPPENMRKYILTTISEHQTPIEDAGSPIAIQQAQKTREQNKRLPVLAAALILSLGANMYLASTKAKKMNLTKRRKRQNKKQL